MQFVVPRFTHIKNINGDVDFDELVMNKVSANIGKTTRRRLPTMRTWCMGTALILTEAMHVLSSSYRVSRDFFQMTYHGFCSRRTRAAVSETRRSLRGRDAMRI